jgi:ABC-type nitrate/sulfonate/bicarbonate transport system permease component
MTDTSAVDLQQSTQRRAWVRVPSISPWLLGIAGFILLVGVWEIVGETIFHNAAEFPAPSVIASSMHHDGWTFYRQNVSTTVWEAARGYFWGNLLAIVLAMLMLLTPVLEKPLLNLGVVSYCLPIVAVGPVFAIVFKGETPKVALAGMSVFFTTLIGTVVGLRSADKTSLDVIHAYGGNTWSCLWKVRLRSALPSTLSALQIAAPASILGAIIGEYLGGTQGIGVAMISAETSLNMARTWGLALAGAAVSGVGFGLVAGLRRLVVPWSRS